MLAQLREQAARINAELEDEQRRCEQLTCSGRGATRGYSTADRHEASSAARRAYESATHAAQAAGAALQLNGKYGSYGSTAPSGRPDGGSGSGTGTDSRGQQSRSRSRPTAQSGTPRRAFLEEDEEDGVIDDEPNDDDTSLVRALKNALLGKLIPVCRQLDITSVKELAEYDYDELRSDCEAYAKYTLLPNTWKKVRGMVAHEVAQSAVQAARGLVARAEELNPPDMRSVWVVDGANGEAQPTGAACGEASGLPAFAKGLTHVEKLFVPHLDPSELSPDKISALITQCLLLLNVTPVSDASSREADELRAEQLQIELSKLVPDEKMSDLDLPTANKGVRVVRMHVQKLASGGGNGGGAVGSSGASGGRGSALTAVAATATAVAATVAAVVSAPGAKAAAEEEVAQEVLPDQPLQSDLSREESEGVFIYTQAVTTIFNECAPARLAHAHAHLPSHARSECPRAHVPASPCARCCCCCGVNSYREEQLNDLASKMMVLRFDKEQVVVEKGEPGTFVAIILGGTLQV